MHLVDTKVSISNYYCQIIVQRMSPTSFHIGRLNILQSLFSFWFLGTSKLSLWPKARTTCHTKSTMSTNWRRAEKTKPLIHYDRTMNQTTNPAHYFISENSGFFSHSKFVSVSIRNFEWYIVQTQPRYEKEHNKPK